MKTNQNISLKIKDSFEILHQANQDNRVQPLKVKDLECMSGTNIFSGNIENYIGVTQVPTGLIGPLKVNGKNADGTFMIPLATTEGALVASYNRGASAITKSGGASVRIVKEGLQRCPAFQFKDFHEAQQFVDVVVESKDQFAALVSHHSRFAKLVNVDNIILGNLVILTFSYLTGDAAGQNMITICTDAICTFLINTCVKKPRHWYIESNLSGDKKSNAINLSTVRGKRLVADVIIPRTVVKEVLKSSPESMYAYYNCSLQAVQHAGGLGMQGHFANGLAALFLATGNDVACVAEAATGIVKVEVTEQLDLYVSVVIPSFVAGTIGGGTHLPTQKAALEIMQCFGKGNSRKFAEISAVMVLAGELSIMAAIAEGHFTEAHKTLGRKK